MASFSDTLATKYGGVPVWGWMGIGVGALVILMILRQRSAAKTAAANQPTQPPALQTNLISPNAAASLAQGAAPMAYMGGSIYNNILNQPGGGPAPVAPGSSGPNIPGEGSTSYFAVRPDNGTWASLAQKYGLSEQQLRDFNTQPQNRGTWGPIDTAGQLKNNEVVIVPWFNVDASNYNAIRKAQGLPPGPA